MSSTIFYKFKSQRNTSRILFDGTGLTVFDLKREIIQENKLGDGTDFQLRIYNPDTNDEYEDDQEVIPRSTSVTVRRSPSLKSSSVHNRNKPQSHNSMVIGNATRYVTGKPRVFANTSKKPERSSAATPAAVSGVTEEERIANMFANQENQWEQTQQAMSDATPIFHRSNNAAATSNADNEGPPPPGYMCYRCGARDHWIKNCPTNTDPNFEGKRIKRTTGIPKKFLKTVDIDPEKMSAEEMAQRKIMITDEGTFVVQIADEHSWENYQRKQQNRLIDGEDSIWEKDHFKDLPDTLKCPITGGLLSSPVKTSNCCNVDFSKKAIEDTLVESDFVCPNCGKEDILLDSLIDDEDKKKEVEEFLKEHADEKKKGQDISPSSGTVDGADNVEDVHVDKKIKLTPNGAPILPPHMPVPPFGMPFPMFPMPFMPPPPPHMMQNNKQSNPQSQNSSSTQQSMPSQVQSK
ncbi:cleavage polyadenylation factor subunit MPE1 NDAI_0C00740 [Naumovozyma dairenensis CBS 421]|uniref:DWNN domain-containing protein n=1 Tax=Naumovozyma dairenensis (strain ATCC 10597 / BCRC 20456 / CBS 421 / NBRC 0211 / NRRL Y-12639) TaxID=1071378 RepID=G0W7H4_NAUDC|nr:hypothetical protein NDAI_0C00740 [Naumovozyma dairenensis CBS 421]CCD23735.1 hypothetical protein NDAI_0C00740 [Naumovozyma dairenensis CBS 421]